MNFPSRDPIALSCEHTLIVCSYTSYLPKREGKRGNKDYRTNCKGFALCPSYW